MQEQGPGQRALRAPRAAGLAGVVFALLLAAAMTLVRLGLPEGAEAGTGRAFTDSVRGDALRAALALVPFAGIFFLWFVGVIRSHVGAAEDKFLSSVSLGSGLVFLAAMFGAAAAADATLAVNHEPGLPPLPAAWDFGRHLSYTLMTEYATRMAAVFVSSMSVIGRRLGVLPHWLTTLGFLTALILLFVSSNVPWAELVFPAWSLLLSLHILGADRGPRPRPDEA
ncbi:hypothetical protein [Streptomyces sp. NRRL B-3648]|uniref:hypothetical protein n=1 Tax=Streptomyces sp. NRRL B-3648 TaxID=1519493 RepID=UPI0006AEC694|nr:hypothetical protein [Streptomyces sp. NRRL B-3648]KOV89352.1 hypothetical protein ADL04_37190 [Streptomyces sp. NRRL B-3648]